MEILVQKIKNLFNKESDYQLGYDVAKDEFTAYYQVAINLADDLRNFRLHLEDEFGKDYANQTEKFIEKNYLNEDILPYLFVAPTLVGQLKKVQPSGFKIVNFILVMTRIYMCWDEPNKIAIAKAYCKFGLLMLDESEPCFMLYLNLFGQYKKEIMEREWDRD